MLTILNRLFLVVCFLALIFQSKEVMACEPSPELTCIAVASNGDVNLIWVNPTVGVFTKRYIYSSATPTGPFAKVDSIFNAATTSYTHIAAGANTKRLYYFIEHYCGTSGRQPATDTLSTMLLTVNNPGNGTARLNWNAISTPVSSSNNAWYYIYREYPIGTWNLYDSTQTLNYIDTISICRATLNYRIELKNNSGCRSISSVSGGTFTDMTVPVIPSLDTATVLNGKAQLGWQKSPSDDTKGYVIYQLIGGVWKAIDTVFGANSTTYTNTISLANSTIEYYRIAAFDSCKNISPLGKTHNTLLVTNTSNGCAGLNILNWNAYNNMPSGLKEYQVYVSTNGGAMTLLGTVNASTITYTHTGLVNTFVYCYVVVAISNTPGTTATSSRLCYTANIPPQPTFNYLKTATVPNNSFVKVNAYVDIAAAISKYKILRSENPSGPFTLVGTTPFTGNNIVSFNDNTAKTSEYSYYYKVIAVDNCGNDTAPSNVARTILLSAKAGFDKQSVLTWNDYSGWAGPVTSYNIYRAIDGIWNTTPIANVPYTAAGTNEFTDDVINFYSSEGLFSYYVEAYEGAGNPYGFTDTSRSNIANVIQDANLFIPKAFCPNGINKVFLPIATFADHEEFEMTIFNRWGQEIYRTTDINQGWDGTASGTKAEQGVYVYWIVIRTGYGEYIERKGSVALLR